ncbi:MAG TPA: hypothetical protein VE398_19380 [Acidobacteriota bacterium]|nr:hypothetical protein [Acidobacteriota bacterium]
MFAKFSTSLALLFFASQPLLYAQRTVSREESVGIALPIGLSNSVIDSHGNLFLFQVQFPMMVIPLTSTTRVTVVTPNKTVVSHDYPGNFSQIVVGEKAVYAINAVLANSPTGSSTALSLVALYLDSKGALPLVPPSLPLDRYAEIKVASGLSSDLLYLVQTIFPVLRPTLPSLPGFVHMVTFDGTNFKDLGKVQLP